MTAYVFDKIICDLATLRSAGRFDKVFGAQQHCFAVNEPLSDLQISQFEGERGVRLPDDYRAFLQIVGDGGAGPYYGLFRLGEMDDGHGHSKWPAHFVGDLGQPFPHRKPWNDLSRYPGDAPDAEDALDSFEREYWSVRHVAGAIPICHQGCALRNWLVTTGPEAGHVWVDLRADLQGLSPEHSRNSSRQTFIEWYRAWLDEALDKAS